MNNLLSKCGGAFYTAPIELPKPETVKTEEDEDEDDEEDGEW